jgi:hypothetical protein
VAAPVRVNFSLCQKPFEPLPNPCESPKRSFDPLALCDRGVILSEMAGAARLNFLPEMEIRTNFRKVSFG